MTTGADKLPETSMRLLEIFAAMMGQRTTVATAESLGISQPAVSAGLRQLETQLGLTLFERTGRHLEPTLEARSLYEEIRPLFGIVRSFGMRARDLRNGRVGRLRVISTPPPGYSLIPQAMRGFLDTRPDVTVSFDVRRLGNVLSAVQTGQADVGVGLTNGRLPNVTSEDLRTGQMVALLPHDHPLARDATVKVGALTHERFIGIDQESHLGRMVAQAFEDAGVTYHPQLETRYCQTAASLAANGMGVCIVDPWSAHPYLAEHAGGQRLVGRPLAQPCPIHCMMFTRRGIPHSGLLKIFMAEIRRASASLDYPGLERPESALSPET
ncbi:DNA-binding transcriptional regulator, LysR family [Poseidonocella pacifica]|uniref:DNA-binding transcriptional regulator, LysR family n=1 Tax=Poseidonocella pacifica TaxID=871651 RepID=A0A1I0YU70_9RHOB|nr:LysR family transcriptional regulator [Poseidonocella pacifica]SFB16925.1 DNA-binding transcriptional regulator, LysR family [Poseidonocella pacifica]